MKKCLFFIGVLLALLLMAGCGEEETAPNANEEDEIIAVVEKNLEATENEDIEVVADTLHQENPEYEAALEETKMLFEQFDMEYELEILEVTVGEEEANVEFSQKTMAVDNKDFEDNMISGFHELRKHEGDWKIYQTEIIDVEPLN